MVQKNSQFGFIQVDVLSSHMLLQLSVKTPGNHFYAVIVAIPKCFHNDVFKIYCGVAVILPVLLQFQVSPILCHNYPLLQVSAFYKASVQQEKEMFAEIISR